MASGPCLMHRRTATLFEFSPASVARSPYFWWTALMHISRRELRSSRARHPAIVRSHRSFSGIGSGIRPTTLPRNFGCAFAAAMAMITGMTQIEAQINWVGAHGFNSVVTMGLASEVNDVSPKYRVQAPLIARVPAITRAVVSMPNGARSALRPFDKSQ